MDLAPRRRAWNSAEPETVHPGNSSHKTAGPGERPKGKAEFARIAVHREPRHDLPQGWPIGRRILHLARL